jgi:hypothetical protein
MRIPELVPGSSGIFMAFLAPFAVTTVIGNKQIYFMIF